MKACKHETTMYLEHGDNPKDYWEFLCLDCGKFINSFDEKKEVEKILDLEGI
ncbi:MAG: hypothetical protein ACXACF_01580 [Candidatus Hermodarchaeia archaeon]|jgi:hypothetical protein